MEYRQFGRTGLKVSAVGTHEDGARFGAVRAPEPSSMVRAQNARREAAPSRSLAACQSVDIGGCQGLATDPPVAAFHLLDQAKGDLAHVLAFIETSASVSLLMISRFCSLLNTSLMT